MEWEERTAWTAASRSAAPEPGLLLVIDDDEADRQQIARWLGPRFPVCEAVTAQDGVEMAQRLQPACVLLDYRLPDANGLEVLTELLVADHSVVLLTGQGDEQIAVHALKAGAVDYLVKDRTSPEELGQAVAQGLARSASRRRADGTSRALRGFARLAEELLLPDVARAGAACAKALERDPGLAEALGEAPAALARLDEHVRGLASFARLDELFGPTERVDLHETAREVSARLAGAGHRAGIVVELADEPVVQGSRMALALLLHELLSCATRAADEAGTGEVRVRGERRAGAYRVTVHDASGPPTRDELSREVFLPFRRGSGRDLSLALAAQVVRRHGGDIWFERDGEDGRRMCFTLPAA